MYCHWHEAAVGAARFGKIPSFFGSGFVSLRRREFGMAIDESMFCFAEKDSR